MEKMGVQLDNYKNLTADLNASLKKNIELLTQQKNNTSKYTYIKYTQVVHFC